MNFEVYFLKFILKFLINVPKFLFWKYLVIYKSWVYIFKNNCVEMRIGKWLISIIKQAKSLDNNFISIKNMKYKFGKSSIFGPTGAYLFNVCCRNSPQTKIGISERFQSCFDIAWNLGIFGQSFFENIRT